MLSNVPPSRGAAQAPPIYKCGYSARTPWVTAFIRRSLRTLGVQACEIAVHDLAGEHCHEHLRLADLVLGRLEHVTIHDDQIRALADGERAAAIVHLECVRRVECV